MQGRAPRRERRAGRGDPGLGPGRRQARHGAARRHAARARDHDAGRVLRGAHPPEHDRPHPPDEDLHDEPGEPDGGQDRRHAGRERPGGGERAARRVHPHRPAPGGEGQRRDRGDLRDQRRRHRQRPRQGPGDSEGAVDRGHRVERADARRDQEHDRRRQGLHGGASLHRGARGRQAGGRAAHRRDRAPLPAGGADRRRERFRARRDREGSGDPRQGAPGDLRSATSPAIKSEIDGLSRERTGCSRESWPRRTEAPGE